MGIIIRQSIKASLVSYLGVLIGAFNTLYIFPKYLGAEGLGLMNVIYSSAVLFLPLLQLGYPSSIVKFFPFFKEKPELKSFLGYAVFIPVLVFVFYMILWPFINEAFTFVFKEKAQLIVDNIFWVLPLSGALVFVNIFEAIARAHYRISFPVLIKTVVWRLIVGTVAFLIGAEVLDKTQLIPFYVYAWLFVLIVIVVYAIKLGKLKFSLNRNIFKHTDYKDFNKYSRYVLLIAIGGAFIQRMDVLMVGSMLGTESAGVLSFWMYFAVLIEIPRRSMQSIIQPVLAQSFKENKMDEVGKLYQKSSINLLLIGGVLFVFLWNNINDVLSLVPNKEEFSGGIYALLFYGLAKVLEMGTGSSQEILMYSKKYKVSFVFQVTLLIIVFLSNYFLIPIYGVIGAAIATCLAMFLNNLIRFVYLYLALSIQPFTIKTLWAVFLLTFFLIIGELLIFDFHPIFNVALRVAITGIPLLFLINKLKLSVELNSLTAKYLKKLGWRKGE